VLSRKGTRDRIVESMLLEEVVYLQHVLVVEPGVVERDLLPEMWGVGGRRTGGRRRRWRRGHGVQTTLSREVNRL